MKKKLTYADQLAFGHQPRKTGDRKYAGALHRMREVEEIVRARFGRVIPPEADAEPYLTAIAFAANAHAGPGSIEAALRGWIASWAPHLVGDAGTIIQPVRMQVEGRRWNLGAADAADLLQVSFEERQRLGLKTIAASDLSDRALKERLAELRRQKDRERSAKRREQQSTSKRAVWLASHGQETRREWEALGISRRTWFRRRNVRDTGPVHIRADDTEKVETAAAKPVAQVESAYAQNVVAQVQSATRNLSGYDDTPVPLAPTVDDVVSLGGGGRPPPATMTTVDTKPRRSRDDPRQLNLFDMGASS